MLGFIENLSLFEIAVIAIVAVIAFGGRLPEAAGQAAAQLQRLRRQLGDLRRESGIDREIDSVRRSIEQNVPRIPRTIDIERSIAREVAAVPHPDEPTPAPKLPAQGEAGATPPTLPPEASRDPSD